MAEWNSILTLKQFVFTSKESKQKSMARTEIDLGPIEHRLCFSSESRQ